MRDVNAHATHHFTVFLDSLPAVAIPIVMSPSFLSSLLLPCLILKLLRVICSKKRFISAQSLPNSLKLSSHMCNFIIQMQIFFGDITWLYNCLCKQIKRWDWSKKSP